MNPEEQWQRSLIQTPEGRRLMWSEILRPSWEDKFGEANTIEVLEWALEYRKEWGKDIPYLKSRWPMNRYEFLPEEDFWALVFRKAEEMATTPLAAVDHLFGLPLDEDLEPPHPLCRVKERTS